MYFQNHEWVVYVDNRANLIVHPAHIVSRIAHETRDKNPTGRFLFRHNQRNCAYDEIEACRRLGKLEDSEATEMRALLDAQKIPPQTGMFVNTLMIQKMGCETTNRFNDLWYELVLGLCHRDQITLSYAMWLSGDKPTILELKNREFIDWPVITDSERAAFQNNGAG